jgi:hypothetical protein
MTETCSMDMLPDASMYNCSTVALSPFRASPSVLYVAGGFFAPCACVPLKESPDARGWCERHPRVPAA